jgi:hypothetical protein
MERDEREARIARNEARFREINEQLEGDLRRLPVEHERAQFVCECANRACAELVEMTFEEYEAVRADPRRFVVVPGHDMPEAEVVIERTERFHVVHKHAPEAAAIAQATDPR